MSKSADAFRTISEVAEWLETPTHVLRFWEGKFPQVKPTKRAGGRRYYRPSDMALLGGIKILLREEGLTIKGVQKVLREKGVKYVTALSQPVDIHHDTVSEIEETVAEGVSDQQSTTAAAFDETLQSTQDLPETDQFQAVHSTETSARKVPDAVSEPAPAPSSEGDTENRTDDNAVSSPTPENPDHSVIKDAEIVQASPSDQTDPSEAPSFLRMMGMPSPAQSEKQDDKPDDLSSDDVVAQGLFGNLPQLSGSKSASDTPRWISKQNRSSQPSFDLDLTAVEVQTSENLQDKGYTSPSDTHVAHNDDPTDTGHGSDQAPAPGSLRSTLLSIDELNPVQIEGLVSASLAIEALVERLSKPVGATRPS